MSSSRSPNPNRNHLLLALIVTSLNLCVPRRSETKSLGNTWSKPTTWRGWPSSPRSCRRPTARPCTSTPRWAPSFELPEIRSTIAATSSFFIWKFAIITSYRLVRLSSVVPSSGKTSGHRRDIARDSYRGDEASQAERHVPAGNNAQDRWGKAASAEIMLTNKISSNTQKDCYYSSISFLLGNMMFCQFLSTVKSELKVKR